MQETSDIRVPILEFFIYQRVKLSVEIFSCTDSIKKIILIISKYIHMVTLTLTYLKMRNSDSNSINKCKVF